MPAYAAYHAMRLATSPLYRRRELAYQRTHAEARLRAAYYTDPTTAHADALWPALFPYLHTTEDRTHDDPHAHA